MRNVYLIGMMGAGKTVIGKALVRYLGCQFVDVDREIMQAEGMSINDIFEKKGEHYFRSVEQVCLHNITRQKNQIVATGGGIILSEENRGLMKNTGVVVYLRTRLNTLASRLAGANDRPLIKETDLSNRLESLLKEREDFYKEADVTIDTDEKHPEMLAQEVAQTIIELFKKIRNASKKEKDNEKN